MVITGTEVNYFFHCHRQLYLFHHKIYQEQNSELVKLGKLQHENRFFDRNSEIAFNGIKIDKIDGDYLIEHKKTKADLKAGEWQLLYYLYRFKEIGITKKGRLTSGSRGEIVKELELTSLKEKKLLLYLDEIREILNSDETPPIIDKPKCKKCAYYEFCYI